MTPQRLAPDDPEVEPPPPPQRPSRPPFAASTTSERALLVGALLLVVLASVRRFQNAAVWDDDSLLQLARSNVAGHDWLGLFAHPTLGSSSSSARNVDPSNLTLYRPLALLSFALDQLLGGGSLAMFHATDLALHLTCVTLVFVLARELLAPEQRRYAPLAAVWFGVTPHLAESHVWISGRFDQLSTLFGLLMLVAFSRARHAARAPTRLRWRCASAAAFLLGLLSKEPLLFALPALACWPPSHDEVEPTTRRTVAARGLALLPFAPALLVYGGLRWRALHGAGANVTLSQLLAAAERWPLLVCDAARNLLLPSHVYSRLLQEDYAELGPAALLLAALACACIGTATYCARRHVPIFAWSLLWFVSTLAPVAPISTRYWPGFGRFLYLPASVFMIGVSELIALFVARRPRLSSVVHGALLLHVLVLALRLAAYTGDFASTDTLFASMIAEAPNRSHGYALLGMSYLDQGRYADAAVLLRKAHERMPSERRYELLLGRALLASGQAREALALADRVRAERRPTAEMELLAAYATLDDPPRSAARLLACFDCTPRAPACGQALLSLAARVTPGAAFRDALEAACAGASGSRPGCSALRALSRPAPAAQSPAR